MASLTAKVVRGRTYYYQRSATELRTRCFAITLLQVSQEQRSLLLGSRLPHDLAAVQRLYLARRLSGRPIRQQVLHAERLGMRGMHVQSMHQRRPLQNDTN